MKILYYNYEKDFKHFVLQYVLIHFAEEKTVFFNKCLPTFKSTFTKMLLTFQFIYMSA